MRRGLDGQPSLVWQEQGQGSCFVFGVQLQHLSESAALVFEIVCLCCQPEPGSDQEGTGAAQVSDYELG